MAEWFRLSHHAKVSRNTRAQQPDNQFKTLMETCIERLSFHDCGIVLESGTIAALQDFASGFEALLIGNRELLAGPLHEAGHILLEVAGNGGSLDVQTYVTLIGCFTRMRDKTNWRYVRKFVQTFPGIKRVVISVGDFHIDSLVDLIASENDRTESDTRFVNVVEIGYQATPQGSTVQEVRATARQVLKKIRYWRALT